MDTDRPIVYEVTGFSPEFKIICYIKRAIINKSASVSIEVIVKIIS